MEPDSETGTADAFGPIDPRVDIGHVHLKVADIDRALAFYCGIFGFELQQRFGDQTRVTRPAASSLRASESAKATSSSIDLSFRGAAGRAGMWIIPRIGLRPSSSRTR